MKKPFVMSMDNIDSVVSEDENPKIEFKEFPKNQLVEIPIDLIEIGSNIRNIEANDELGLEELGESIKEHGQLQPCIVYQNGEVYTIKEGSRRFKACLYANIPTLKCIVEEPFADEVDRIVKQAIENEQRKDMSPREREEYMAKLLDLGMSQTEIAKVLHKGKGWVSEALRAHDIVQQNQDILGSLADDLSTRDVYKAGALGRDELGRIVEETKKNGGGKSAFKSELDNVLGNKKSGDGYTNEEVNEKFGIKAEDSPLCEKTLKIKFSVDDTEKHLKVKKNLLKTELEKFISAQIENFYKEKGYICD